MKLCRLSLIKRLAYIQHWPYAVLLSLQRLTALPQVVETLVAGLSEEFSFATASGQMAEFITADEVHDWHDYQCRLTCITYRESFRVAADELENCIDDLAYLYHALTLGSLYVRLTAVRQRSGHFA